MRENLVRFMVGFLGFGAILGLMAWGMNDVRPAYPADMENLGAHTPLEIINYYWSWFLDYIQSF